MLVYSFKIKIKRVATHMAINGYNGSQWEAVFPYTRLSIELHYKESLNFFYFSQSDVLPQTVLNTPKARHLVTSEQIET